MKTKHEMREETIRRLRELQKGGTYTTAQIVYALTEDGGWWIDDIIDLLIDDDGLTEDDYLELLKDAAGDYQTMRLTYNELARMYDLMRARMKNDMVDLPVDVNGKVIHVGDRVVEHEDGHDFIVDGYEYDGEWWVFHRDGIRAPTHDCTHYKVEDALNELVEKVYEDAWNDGKRGVHYDIYEFEELVKVYAKKLRLKEDE